MSPTILRTSITLYLFIFITSIASAEEYKWKDANGMHFTDSPSPVSGKYRDKINAETRKQFKNINPIVRVMADQQNSPVATQEYNSTSVTQAKLDQQRNINEALLQPWPGALADRTRDVDDVFQSLASDMVLWLIIGFFLLLVWIVTIVDIVRSEFVTPSNKTVWMLLVLLLPVLGMMLYYIFGLNQKSSYRSYNPKTGSVI